MLIAALLSTAAVLSAATTTRQLHRHAEPGALTTTSVPPGKTFGAGVTLVFGGGPLWVDHLGSPGGGLMFPDIPVPGYPNRPVATGSAVVFISKGEAYAIGASGGFTRLGQAVAAFASAQGDSVWLVRDAKGGQEVLQVRADGATATPAVSLPPRATPVADAGEALLLLQPDQTLEVWDSSTRSTLASLGRVAYFIDTRQFRVVFTRNVCHTGSDCDLHIADLSDGTERTVQAPPGYAGFLGGGAISPDGSVLAVFVARADLESLSAALVLVDMRTGLASRPIEGSDIRYGEPVGSAVWSPSGDRVFFCGLDQPMRTYRVGGASAIPLEAPGSYAFAVTKSSLTPDLIESGRAAGGTGR